MDLAVRSLFALSVQLGDKPYLMGDTPCGTDATAFGALAGILTPFFDSTAAPAGGEIRQPRRLCRPADAPILSGVRLEAGAAGGSGLNKAALSLSLRAQARLCSAASSASSSAILRIARGERGGHIRRIEFLRDVLRAIGIPRRDPEQDHLFGPRACSLAASATLSAPDRRPPRAPRPRS